MEYYGIDAEIALKDVEVAIFLGGFPRKKGMERKELIEKNGHIFENLGKVLNIHANKNCKSIVIANPANTNCLILSHYANSISKKNFTCLTRLDQNRAVFQIAQKIKCDISDISNVIIWGNHSSTQFPDLTFGKYKDKNLKEVISNSKDGKEWYENEFITKIQKRGAEIIDNRGFSR